MSTYSTPVTPDPTRRPRRRVPVLAALASLAAVTGTVVVRATADPASAAPPPAVSAEPAPHHGRHEMGPEDRVAAMLATAGYQDVAAAEADGYTSSVDALGCFQNPAEGGMGVHYIDARLLDATVDAKKPEALVYELGLDGTPIGLVAHEYIVPTDAWTSNRPPRLFDLDFHRHPVLPLWVLHAWLWKDNPAGVFEDWNPAVRLCPPGVPVFGKDRPVPTTKH